MKKTALSLLLLAASYAQAAEYTTVQAEQSAINFTYQQMGVKMDGSFRRFTAQLNFDPARLNAAKATFEVELASIDAGSSEADQEVAGKPWFNTKTFPTARFVSTQVKSLGGNRYEVGGQLSIKGQTREIVLPATFKPEGKQGEFTGAFSIKRGDFNIGEGSWAKFDIVANDILIKFRITASSK